METVTHALTTLETITWPHDHDLEGYNPHKPTARGRTTPGSTDFGLSHTTLTHTRAQTILHHARATIQHALAPNISRPLPPPNYAQDLKYIKHTLAQGHIKPVLAPTYRAIINLARHAERACGYATEPTSHTCPNCGHRLHQTQTSEGLTPTHHCPHCHTAYTTSQQTQQTLAAILANAHKLNVTQTQAATILGLDVKVIHKRVRDRHLQATNGTTNKKTYLLADLL